jgi:restriction endonuclease Mrr
MTPEQIIFQQWSILHENHVKKLRSLITKKSKENPEFFRKITERFIEKMTGIETSVIKYSGTLENGDIDMICQRDNFGFDKFCVVASIRDELIAKKELQKFADSFDNTRNGMFITLSGFEPDVDEEINNAFNIFVVDDKKIQLMNGYHFAEWLGSYDMGARTIETYEIREIDYNFIEHLLDDSERITHFSD